MLRSWLRTARQYCNDHGITMPDDLTDALKSTLDLSGIASEYSAAIIDAMQGFAFDDAHMVTSRNLFIKAMARSFAAAFDLGYEDGGGDPNNMDAAANDWFGAREDAERENIIELFRTLKAEMADDPTMDVGSWISDRSAGYVGSLNDVYSMGKVFGKAGEALTFDGDDGTESCPTCQKLKGETHPARWWVENDLIPTQGNTNFECGGWRCQHGLKDAQGNWVTLNPVEFT